MYPKSSIISCERRLPSHPDGTLVSLRQSGVPYPPEILAGQVYASPQQ